MSMRLTGALGMIFVISFGFGVGVGNLRGMSGATGGAFALVISLLLTGAARVFILTVTAGGGAVAQAIAFPTGNSTPYAVQYSFQESLAARGDVAGALESFEAVIQDSPDSALPRIRAAELYAKGSRDLKRAAELFRSVRDMPAASSRDVLYASSRLVDLYDGPLEDPGRALVELRRIIERFPSSPAASSARNALPVLKARLAQAHPDQ
jgi:hypothetical protein